MAKRSLLYGQPSYFDSAFLHNTVTEETLALFHLAKHRKEREAIIKLQGGICNENTVCVDSSLVKH